MEPRGVAVLARVDQALLEAVASRPVRDEARVLVAGRHDYVVGEPVAGRGPQDPPAIVAVDALEPRAEAHVDPVARGVALQVGDDLVAGGEHGRAARVAAARQLRERPARVQPQPVIAAAPGRRDRVGPFEEGHRDAPPSQLRRGSKPGGPGPDHNHTLFAHTRTVGRSTLGRCAIAHTSRVARVVTEPRHTLIKTASYEADPSEV